MEIIINNCMNIENYPKKIDCLRSKIIQKERKLSPEFLYLILGTMSKIWLNNVSA